jgi:hypothetical protein
MSLLAAHRRHAAAALGCAPQRKARSIGSWSWPLALPVFFLIDYSAWLWWYGHNLNAMGAFTVKPFMPTVFGDGKVAQFSTHSYPSWGFGLMLLLSSPCCGGGDDSAAQNAKKHQGSAEMSGYTK